MSNQRGMKVRCLLAQWAWRGGFHTEVQLGIEHASLEGLWALIIPQWSMQRNRGEKIEWERLEISSRKLEIKGNISCKDGLDKGQKWYEPNRSRRYSEKVARIHRRIIITRLEPNILECKVKWALGSITTNKASGGDGIPVELNPKRWCCESAALNMPANLENSAVATGLDWKKVSFHSNPKERQCQRMLKLLHSCTHIAC